MSIERVVGETVLEEPQLVADAARAVPKAWGALAGKGVMTFRTIHGRPPDERERRAIWAGLWREVERARLARTEW